MSDPVRPHRWQPTRLPRPWDSPGKNTGVGCHFLLQCMNVKSESEVAQSCPTLHDPMDWSPPGSSIHGIFQARLLGGTKADDFGKENSVYFSMIKEIISFMIFQYHKRKEFGNLFVCVDRTSSQVFIHDNVDHNPYCFLPMMQVPL